MNIIYRFFQKPIFSDKRFIFTIWFSAVFIAALRHLFKDNNYQIFKYVFYHTLEQVNLYDYYPDKYFDSNHYGPIFSIIIAPFALLPDIIGIPLWEIAIAATLLFAIYKLPVIWKAKVIIYWVAMHEIYVNATNSQTNTLIAALIIGAFICIRSEKDFWGALFIMLGFFIKLYGIVGLAFFFFSRHKIKLSGYLLLWAVVLFVLPMLISSPQFIVQSYFDWYESLSSKDMSNTDSLMQNISAIGMIRKVFGLFEISNFVILIPAALLFLVQYVQVKAYSNIIFQFGVLASTLIFVVLFSTGSETCTYIIAITGVAIWFLVQKRPYNKYILSLFIFTLVLTICAGSDIAPDFIRKGFIRPYALKALPHLIVWLTLVYQLVTFKTEKVDERFSYHYIAEDEKIKE
ncbi:MAG: glycosyltransferase family 87 protein [Dysgonomonas sp.]